MHVFPSRPQAGVVLAISMLLWSSAADADLGWRPYLDPSRAYSMMYPALLFDGAPVSEHGGITLTSGNGARLYIFGGPNPGGRSSEAIARQLSVTPDTAVVTYRQITPTWLVLSGYLAQQPNEPLPIIFYERVAFSADHAFLAGFRLVYPQAQRAIFDPIIAAMGRSLRGPNMQAALIQPASPLPGSSQSDGGRHQAWCRANYPTYDPTGDTYLRYDAQRVPCTSPF
jgi:hypothetical protein